MHVEILSSAAAYPTLRDTWNSLVCDDPADLFGLDMTSSFEWFEATLAAFPEATESRVVVAYDKGEVIGLLPVVINRSSRLGPRLLAPTELYGGRNGPLLKRLDTQICVALLNGLDAACPGWSSLQLTLVADSGNARVISEGCDLAGYRLFYGGEKQSPHFPIAEDPTILWKGISKDIRQRIRSGEKKLSEMGAVTYNVVDQASDAERLIDIIISIEENSWKHEAGSAITNHPRQEVFYRELFPRALSSGWLRCRLLCLDARPIAYLLGVRGGGVFCGLKTSFVNDFANLSLSHIVRYRELLELSEDGIHEYDFMGKLEPHKLRWSPGTRIYTRQTFFIYNRRYNGWLHFQWQKLKNAIKRKVAADLATDNGND